MTVFAYKAIDAGRTEIEGTISADTPHQAREELRARGLRVRKVHPRHNASSRFGGMRLGAARYSNQAASLMRELSTLLSAGIPLLESLKSVGSQQRGAMRTAIALLQERVASGNSLAEAMADQPEIFESLCVHMVEVGENAGTLESVLGQWADFKERSSQFKDRVTTALLYPAFVLVVGMAVTIFLMTYVLPMLLESLIESGKTLPWPTRVAQFFSDLLVNYGLVIGPLVLGALFGIMLVLRTPRGQRFWHRLLLKLPLFGSMSQKQAIARLSFLISTLTKSGIPFLQAVEITSRSTQNLIIRDALGEVSKAVRTGREIGPALEATGAFPLSVVQIFSVGQESGQLEEMLDRLADDYQRQVSRLADRLTAVLEPVLILTLAVFVGFILFATVLPILEAGNVM